MKKLLNLILITIFSSPSCSKKEIPQPIYDYHSVDESWIINIDNENILSFLLVSLDLECFNFKIRKTKFDDEKI